MSKCQQGQGRDLRAGLCGHIVPGAMSVLVWRCRALVLGQILGCSWLECFPWGRWKCIKNCSVCKLVAALYSKGHFGLGFPLKSGLGGVVLSS